MNSKDVFRPYTCKKLEKQKRIVTIINGKVETTNIGNSGDFVLCGPLAELYVMTFEKLIALYDIVNGKLKTRPLRRQVAKYMGDESMKITTSWGEEMIVESGDYIVKSDDGTFYRIEKSVFRKTYRFI